MIDYRTGDPLALLGMSGVGKTRMAAMLRREKHWFHYSVDYRIGTRYMDEPIVDNFKREAMKVPLLRELLMSDSIYISSNITFDNLDPLSTYLGKPGDPAKGGIPFEEYVRRQRQHRAAEIAALLDTPHFIERAREIYGYTHFVCDTGGSICEVVEPQSAADPVLTRLSEHCLIVYIEGDGAHAEALKARFNANPKPMYYNETFLLDLWGEYLGAQGVDADRADPDDFIRWGFARLIDWRRPRYEAIARHWGVTVSALDVEACERADDFLALVQAAIERKVG